MKYNININQKGLEYDKEISLIDASVIDWLYTFCGTNNKKINAQKKDGFTWVNCQHLINDMPLLRIKSRAGSGKLLTRLEKLGYIEIKREPRKLFVKSTNKMDNLYVSSGKQDVNYEKEVVNSSKLSCKLGDTNHNTNTIILDTNTISSEDNIKDTNAVTLPLVKKDGTSTGKMPVNRLLYLYSKLFYNTYRTYYRADFKKDIPIIKNLLINYTEVQIAYMLCVFFDWHGMSGSDSKEYDFVTGVVFPIAMFKKMSGKFEIYIRNVLKYKFDDDKELLIKVGEYLKNIK
jgi:hypothetical protein